MKKSLLLAVVLVTFGAQAADDASSRCEALRKLDVPGLKIDSSKVPSPEPDQPEYCRVTGMIDRAGFELRLPTTHWNGKFYMAGCGTFCGVIGTADPAYKTGISRGYATIITDAGHQSWTPAGTKWARDDAQARSDHAWRAVHRTAVTGRQITQSYYGGDVQRAYFNGCSNGGRQALMEAARFPEDFDGIVAEAPAQNVLANSMMWTYANLADTGPGGKAIFDIRKLPLLRSAVAKACGDADGAVSDPQACTFDPVELQCQQGDRPDCLSADEVRVVRAWYAGPPASSEYTAFGGVPRGSEAFWAGRADTPILARVLVWFVTRQSLDGVLAPLKIGSTMLLRDVLSTPAFAADYDSKNFDPARDLPPLKAYTDEMTPSRDLSGLARAGRKLLITQGTADVAIPPAYTIAYWQEAKASLGEHAADTMRLFMVPGMGHCGNGEGPRLPVYNQGDYDPLTALENWVEHDVAPDAIIATRRDDAGQVTRSEPLCAMPARTVFSGSGDRRDAATWVCR